MKRIMEWCVTMVLVLAAWVAALGLSGTAWGQATTSLRGTVTDQSGAAVVGAKVTLNNRANGFSRETASSRDGTYEFLLLPPATYDLEVAATGFQTYVRSHMDLEVATPHTANVQLKLGEMTQMVTVSESAAAVNTTDATIGNTFNKRQITTLPFEGRNPVEILSLQPGVAYVGNTVDRDVDSRNGAVNGARSDQSNVTLDGVDNNDQTKGYAFTGVLRSTLDSIEEFRVTTAGGDADEGRSSGGQVTLVTRSGTNNFHGSLYEYHRPTNLVANDFFNKLAEIRSGLPNSPGKFLRNTFGGRLGGPIKKDRIFFFGAYEGQRTRENTIVTRTVPSETLRQGIIQYIACAPSNPNCLPSDPSNFVQAINLTTQPITFQGQTLPASGPTMDPLCSSPPSSCPLGPGANPAVMAVFQGYPLPNTDSVGDVLNTRGFTFSAPAPAKLNTYIAKLDFKLTEDGKHSLFIRANLQSDRIAGTGASGPQFPGDPPDLVTTDNSKGFAVGYTALLSNTLTNDLHWGFIRQGTGMNGANNTQHHIIFQGLDDPQAFTRSTFVTVPVANLVDDLSWIKGKHTIQFGGNWRQVNNHRIFNELSFSDAQTKSVFLNFAAIANTGSSLDPAAFGFPAVSSFFSNSYDLAVTSLAGIITQVDAVYDRNKQGNLLPEGSFLRRHFRANEFETYVLDSWRLKPSLTLTFGLRYTLLQPPYETNGVQVAPSFSLHDYFAQRVAAMQQGQTFNPLISYDLAGQANGKKPYWGWDYRDVAPRIAFAWAPHADSGFLHALLGGAGKTSIRGGWGIYYDHFGQGIVNTFDRQGSFGLINQLTNPASAANNSVDTDPRFTDLFTIPTALTPPAPPNGFPLTPISDPVLGFNIAWGLDDKLKTPYSHAFDFSISRELPRNFTIEAAYVGRLGRRLLQQPDLAMPLDLVDPKSKMDYFTAATQFVNMINAGTPVQNVQPISFWEDFFPTAANQPAAGLTLGFSAPCAAGTYPANPTATQAMYELYSCVPPFPVTALQDADAFCIPACSTINGKTGPFHFYSGQFSSLAAWNSTGQSSYHALQIILRHKMANGLQFDFNYTFSKSTDTASDSERVSIFEGVGLGNSAATINSFAPNQLRGPSDFDTTHQFNANWIFELPSGHGKHWGAQWNRGLNAILGGWEVSSLYRWTSGFPFSIANCNCFPTNFDLNGNSVLTGSRPVTGTFTDKDGDPNVFQNPQAAINSFTPPLPGQAGQRNNLRGPGYFGVDLGVDKSWTFGESRSVRFSWETFNLTNSVRFDAAFPIFAPDNSTSFGKFTDTLTKPRAMQFALRFEF